MITRILGRNYCHWHLCSLIKKMFMNNLIIPGGDRGASSLWAHQLNLLRDQVKHTRSYLPLSFVRTLAIALGPSKIIKDHSHLKVNNFISICNLKFSFTSYKFWRIGCEHIGGTIILLTSGETITINLFHTQLHNTVFKTYFYSGAFLFWSLGAYISCAFLNHTTQHLKAVILKVWDPNQHGHPLELVIHSES